MNDSAYNVPTYDLIPEGRSAIEGKKPCKKGCHHFIPHFNGDILFGGQKYTNISTINSSEKLNDKNFSFNPGKMDLFIELFNGVSTEAKGSQDGKESEKK